MFMWLLLIHILCIAPIYSIATINKLKNYLFFVRQYHIFNTKSKKYNLAYDTAFFA